MNSEARRAPARTLAWLLLLCAVTLSGCNVRGGTTDQSVVRGTGLAACTSEGTPFEDLEFWEMEDEYHRRVGEIVAEALMQASAKRQEDALNSGDSEEDAATAADCTATATGEDKAGGPLLTQLASELPPWKDTNTLITSDMAGAILLEYLRTYECSLQEHRYFLVLSAQGDVSSSAGSTASLNTQGSMEILNRSQLLRQVEEDRSVIDQELATARPALERALVLIQSNRLEGLQRNLICILRASLDLRNVLALLSEANACLGRITSTRGILRDPLELSE